MLSVLAASIGTTRRIRLKSRWCEPSVVWSVVVAPSGTQKSAGPEEASGPLRQRQREAFKSHEAEMQEHAVALAKYETARQQWMSRGMSKNETPPPRPAEPQPERHIVQDVTVEALAPILKANPRGLLVLRDELAGWLKSFDAYKSGKGGDAAHWLEMHGARELTVDRKGGDPKTIFVPRAAVSVTGTIQPRVLQESLGREQFESGLAARLLLAMPPRRPKKWTDAEVSPSALEGYTRVVHGLLSLRHSIGPDGAPEPIDLTLTFAGRQAFIDFYTEHAGRQADTGDEDLSAAFSKLEGYAARFALIVHCVRGVIGDPTLADAGMIDEDSIGRGVGIARWFASETERIY
ncbi:MAG: YfjI family protein, partial [Phycisphaerales bacterium]